MESYLAVVKAAAQLKAVNRLLAQLQHKNCDSTCQKLFHDE